MFHQTQKEFHKEAQANWTAAVNKAVGPVPAEVQIWKALPKIERVLSLFMGKGKNHGHYPSGGGRDFLTVKLATELNCLEFMVGERVADIVRPTTLALEYFPEAPGQSFLFLELENLAPSGVYDEAIGMSEELVEISPGDYRTRSVWDDGFYGYDLDGREKPLPLQARLINRRFGGSIMLVANGSIWNGPSGTYDGRHNTIGRIGVRHLIQQALDRK